LTRQGTYTERLFRAVPTNGGTVFELIPNNGTWTEKALHSFSCGDDGCGPEAGHIIDAKGNLYGTTFYGGAYHGGMVFVDSQQRHLDGEGFTLVQGKPQGRL
jgi:hypothetical protein